MYFSSEEAFHELPVLMYEGHYVSKTPRLTKCYYCTRKKYCVNLLQIMYVNIKIQAKII